MHDEVKFGMSHGPYPVAKMAGVKMCRLRILRSML